MKIQHSVSSQIIDVPDEHAQMLLAQGWIEHISLMEPDVQPTLPKLGRPRKIPTE